jgi:hypothetical protein
VLATSGGITLPTVPNSLSLPLAPKAAKTKVAKPFAALLGVSTLLLGLLFVAGFAYRWSYYYNFGVQHLVFTLGYQSFLVTAFELVRTWANGRLVVIYVVAPLLALALGVALLRRIARSDGAAGLAVRHVGDITGSSSMLVLDLLRTAIVVLGTFRAGYTAGYRAFQAHALNTANNPLPVVTVLFGGADAAARPTHAIRCGAEPGAGDAPPFVGGSVADLQSFHRTCNSATTTWRLLYRDENFVYVFASEGKDPRSLRRPLTMILPDAKDTLLILK